MIRTLLLVMLLVVSGAIEAAQGLPIEEVIVNAQRVDEAASKVPISVSAFTEADIDDRQIIALSDLQLNVPNLGFVPNNFGASELSIRGIGAARSFGGTRGAAGPSVPTHINGAIVGTRADLIEFYDLERIEVLRGPQGTLYGRTATAGSLNLVTRRPEFSGHGGYVDAEYGNHDHTRFKGALNLAFGERLAFRAAGMSLSRDGYIENKAADQLPGLSKDLDDRDIKAFRLTLEWRPSEAASAWLMYSRFDEDDSRVRITNQVCKQSRLPNIGCEPGVVAFDAPNVVASLGGQIAAGAGAIPPGAVDSESGLIFEFPRPPLGLRSHHTDFDPTFEYEEDLWLLGAEWDFGKTTVSMAASYSELSFHSQQDYNMDVGYELFPTAENPSGLWPTSAPTASIDDIGNDGPCDLESGLSGVLGGCTLNDDLRRSFAIDDALSGEEFWSIEVRVRSKSESRLNFLLGANFLENDFASRYAVASNTLDVVSVYGSGGLGLPRLYPGIFDNASRGSREAIGVFGELYFDLTDRIKLTVGVRYSQVKADLESRQAFLNSINIGTFDGLLDSGWVRTSLLSYLSGGAPSAEAVALAGYHGALEDIEAASSPVELVTALQLVPLVPSFGEAQELAGLPTSDKWDRVTGRVALDWQMTDAMLVYASFNQGYRAGGINPFRAPLIELDNNPKYKGELVNAYEIGFKSYLANDRLLLNAAFFVNDYDDLQINEYLSAGQTINVDADTKGLELEAIWRPEGLPGLQLEISYGRLDTELGRFEDVDIIDRTQGDPSLVVLRDTVARGGSVYTAAVEEVLPLVPIANDFGFAIPVAGTYDNGIPVFFDSRFLDFFNIATSPGKLAALRGNDLPNAPAHSVRFALAHSWTLAPGVLTLRYDYYWQDSSYSRIFNAPADRLPSWSQHNASLIFESASGRWSARAWIRNIGDEDIVTNHFLASDDSGNFRNYFLAEPRIFGAAFRYNFGVQ